MQASPYAPEKILKDFIAKDIFSGDSHNIAVSEEGELYSWGGTMINSAWISQGANESKLKLMEDLKRRKKRLKRVRKVSFSDYDIYIN